MIREFNGGFQHVLLTKPQFWSLVQAKGWGIDGTTSDRLFTHVVRKMHGAEDDLKEMRGDTYMDKIQLAGAYAMIKEDLLDTIRK